ncbi:MAG: sortase [Chloroflexia bacterium]|nr:sortase [Chloroflexia bacterium]
MQLSQRTPSTPRRWLLWGLGNVLILSGLFALLYVGGLQAYVLGRHLPQPEAAPSPLRLAPALSMEPTHTPTPALPLLDHPSDPERSVEPVRVTSWRSRLSRIVIPTIQVDSPVIEVGWHTEVVDGRQVTVWDVARFAVGHHYGSANPGEGSNIVLAGHVAGRAGAVFLRLIELEPGDPVLLYGDGRQYLYVVEEVLLLPEVGQPLEVRLRNAQYMASTMEEVLTLITCWPVHAYDQRLVVLARPYRAAPFPRPDLIAN